MIPKRRSVGLNIYGTKELEMKLCQASVTTLFSFFIFWSRLVSSVKGSDNPTPYYMTDVAINCGYLGNSTAHDGRQWLGDTGSRSVISMLQPKGKSTSSTVDQTSVSADPIPYMTARVSATQFYYTFQVNPGQKFIRLHFYPSSYRRFEKSQDFFTVEAGPFTLLQNFSASIAADALGVRYLVKEFCLNVGEGEYLNITFSPSQSTKKRNLYAFVNGIEIISMPTGLYYTPDGDLGARVVGQNRRYVVDNSSALEMVHRLNIGGSYISPVEDFGMFRMWTEDIYLLESNLQYVNNLVHGIKFEGKPVFTVPLKIYYTTWKTGSKYGRANEMHNFTWKIPVDLGFGYLVRLHFCDFGLEVTEGELREFNVLMNNQIAETKANVIRLSGGTGVPTYQDYVVIVRGDRKEGKFDLLITLQSSDKLVVGLFHGLEIFKLSSLDNNLASPNPVSLRQVSTSWNLEVHNLLLAFGKIKAIVKGMTILIILLSIIVFKLRPMWEVTCHEEKDNPSVSTEQSFHRFSLAQIKSATENFSDAFLIGRGGFGKVYKGFICDRSMIVAVKRLKSNSYQGAQEFWTEIETLSKIRHINLVSLIGYCNEYDEMIIVYEYMPRGTLADNLYKIGRNVMDGAPLTWEQRLRICIGAARGLDYLHTGIEHGVIHRDVKDSNILLDENLTAKISDFGLSKLEKITESQCYISTKVRGTFGYLDPDYLITQKLTRKSDIYSFGVVLLVVLCGKPAVDRSIPDETHTLLLSFRECCEKGGIEDIIDPNLQGTISSEGLSEFVTCIGSCLHSEPKKRPTMAQVVARLECLLERQQIIPSISDEAIAICQPCEVENLQPSQCDQYMAPPIVEESVTTIPPVEEELIDEGIHDNAEVKSREVLSSGEKDNHTSVQKPLWIRPWEALRNIGKPMKKTDLVPAASVSQAQTPHSEDEILQSLNLKNFSFAELKAATRNFRRDTLIGEGEFGSVFKGWIDEQSLRPSKRGIGMAVAVKTLNEDWMRTHKEELLAKINYLGQLHHPNLVKLIGYCLEDDHGLLVFEFMPKGSMECHLFGKIQGSDLQPLSWSQRTKIALGAARGLAFLHGAETRVIYGGKFKTSYILLDSNYNAKLCGFGFAGPEEVEPFDGYVPTVSVWHCDHDPCEAPEHLITGRYTAKSDVYNFGVVILEILSGRRARDMNPPKNEFNLVERENPYFTDKYRILGVLDTRLQDQYSTSQALKLTNLALHCLSKASQWRPTMDEVVTELEQLQDLKDKTIDHRNDSLHI